METELQFYKDTAKELDAAGFPGLASHNRQMAQLTSEKITFYKTYPTRRARRSARKMGVVLGVWY